MMKRSLFAAAAILLLLAMPGCARPGGAEIPPIGLDELIAKSKNITEYSYEAVAPGNPVAVLHRAWVKDGKARIESQTTEGNKRSAIHGLILDEKDGIIDRYTVPGSLADNANMTYAVKEGETATIRHYTFLGEVDELDPARAKIISYERVDNHNCAVVDTGNTDDKKTLWLSVDLGVPIKMELNGQLIRYEKIKTGPGSVADKSLLKPEP